MVDERVSEGVRAVVQEIYDRDGSVTAPVLVEMARPVNSPAHNGFEWDDTKAGEEFRLIQSRRWIRVTPIYVKASAESESVVVERLAWVPPASGEGREGEYKPISVIVENIDEYQRALAEANTRLTAAKRAVNDLVRVAKGKPESHLAILAAVERGLSVANEALAKLA